MKVPIRYDRAGDALYRGGYADVWKGECRGRDVAVKVVKTYQSSDLQGMIGVGRCTCSLSTASSLTKLVEVLQGGGDVEVPSASERPAASGSNDVGESVRDGIGLDDEWEHLRIRRGTSRCRPAWACKLPVQNPPASAPLTVVKTPAGRCR